MNNSTVMIAIATTTVVAVVAWSAAKSGEAAKPRTTESTQTATVPSKAPSSSPSSDVVEPDRTLLFFLNPHGRPCQMQDRILGAMAGRLTGKAAVRYVKTTVPDDRGDFFTYGIRGLPSLVLVDNEGEVLHRFAPGIHDEEAILEALTK